MGQRWRARSCGERGVTRRPGGITVLEVAGEVDIATAPRLRERLVAEVGRCRPLVLDLRQVDFLGIEGAHVLRDAVLLAGANGVGVALVGLSPLGRCAAHVVGLPVARVHHSTLPAALEMLDQDATHAR